MYRSLTLILLPFLSGKWWGWKTQTYTIPASSSPWSDTTVDANGNKGATAQFVHYAGVENDGANYTWYTATASTQGSSYSICPRGWKLPTRAQYDTLLSNAGIANNSAGSTKIRGNPYNFPYAGLVSAGSLLNVGSYGYYWSSTANGSDSAYHLYFNSGAVYTRSNDRYYGFSIRCIAP